MALRRLLTVLALKGDDHQGEATFRLRQLPVLHSFAGIGSGGLGLVAVWREKHVHRLGGFLENLVEFGRRTERDRRQQTTSSPEEVSKRRQTQHLRYPQRATWRAVRKGPMSMHFYREASMRTLLVVVALVFAGIGGAVGFAVSTSASTACKPSVAMAAQTVDPLVIALQPAGARQ